MATEMGVHGEFLNMVTIVRLAKPGGLRVVAAESVLCRHQFMILNRAASGHPNSISTEIGDRFRGNPQHVRRILLNLSVITIEAGLILPWDLAYRSRSRPRFRIASVDTSRPPGFESPRDRFSADSGVVLASVSVVPRRLHGGKNNTCLRRDRLLGTEIGIPVIPVPCSGYRAGR